MLPEDVVRKVAGAKTPGRVKISTSRCTNQPKWKAKPATHAQIIAVTKNKTRSLHQAEVSHSSRTTKHDTFGFAIGCCRKSEIWMWNSSVAPKILESTEWRLPRQQVPEIDVTLAKRRWGGRYYVSCSPIFLCKALTCHSSSMPQGLYIAGDASHTHTHQSRHLEPPRRQLR